MARKQHQQSKQTQNIKKKKQKDKTNAKLVLKSLKGKNFHEQAEVLKEKGGELKPYQLSKAISALSSKSTSRFQFLIQ